MSAARPTGVAFGPAEVSKSEELALEMPDLELPPFVLMKDLGRAGVDDFGMSADLSLVVSERIWELLVAGGVRDCTSEPWRPES